MDELVEGSSVLYVLTEKDAEAINAQIAKYPERHPIGAKVEAGQRTKATVVISHGKNHEGEERLALRLEGTTPVEKAYHVSAADLHYDDGAWHTVERGE